MFWAVLENAASRSVVLWQELRCTTASPLRQGRVILQPGTGHSSWGLGALVCLGCLSWCPCVRGGFWWRLLGCCCFFFDLELGGAGCAGGGGRRGEFSLCRGMWLAWASAAAAAFDEW